MQHARRIALTTLAIVVVLAVAGCTSPEPTPTATPSPTPTVTETPPATPTPSPSPTLTPTITPTPTATPTPIPIQTPTVTPTPSPTPTPTSTVTPTATPEPPTEEDVSYNTDANTNAYQPGTPDGSDAYNATVHLQSKYSHDPIKVTVHLYLYEKDYQEHLVESYSITVTLPQPAPGETWGDQVTRTRSYSGNETVRSHDLTIWRVERT